jgi:hypothetical protein
MEINIMVDIKITTWTDHVLESNKKELQDLEIQLNELNIQKGELEKLLADFQHRHTIELGDIISEILSLRRNKYKENEEKFAEASRDYENYSSQYKIEKEKKIFNLTKEQEQELKKKYRKAAVICHPDKVSEEFKADAERIFDELKQATDNNDLAKVVQILESLEAGNFFKASSETISDREKLETQIVKVKGLIQNLEAEITSIKQSKTYQTINSIDDWDDYFTKTKIKLSLELDSMRKEVEQAKI